MLILLNRPFVAILIIALVAGIMHARIFNTDIVGPHAWRQTQTLATIEHFARESFDITQPHTYHFVNGTTLMRMEFPLLQWTIAGAYKLIGEHLWLLRSLLFLIGLITVAGMGQLAKTIFNRNEAFLIAAWAFCFSPLFYYYCINPLPDLLALCFAVWGLVYFFRWNTSGELKTLMICVGCLALATLCKLPFAIFYAAFFGYLVNAIRARPIQFRKILIRCCIVVVSAVAPFAWYAVVMSEWTPNLVTSGIFAGGLSAKELLSVLTGTLISTLPELLLNYATVPLFLAGLYYFLRKKRTHNPHRAPLFWISIAVIFYYVFEINAITLVHDYYLFPFLPILFLIVTYGAIRLYDGGKYFRIAVTVLVLVMPITAFLRSDGRWNESDPGFNQDLITYKEQLRSATPAEAKIVIGNDESAHISLYYTQHQGWNFHGDQLSAVELEAMIYDDAKFLYSDSRTIEMKAELLPYFDDTVATIGSFRIISLKMPVSGN